MKDYVILPDVTCDMSSEIREYFDIKEITPVDMFPGTYHVENVCLLERKI